MSILDKYISEIKNFFKPKNESEPAKVQAAEQKEQKKEQKNSDSQPIKEQPVPEQVEQQENAQRQSDEQAESEHVTQTKSTDDSGVGDSKKEETKQPEQAKTENPTHASNTDNSIKQDVYPEIWDEICKNISQRLSLFYGMNEDELNIRSTDISIVRGNEQYSLILNKKFEDKLRLLFDNQQFHFLANGIITVSVKDPSDSSFDVYKGIIFADFVTRTIDGPHVQHKARISVCDGKGSLKQKEYILDIDADNKKNYCIGRGDTSTKGGVFRKNDIVIKDDETDPTILDLNRYVSSSHANIEFLDGGFYIRAMQGGLANGNATKYIRNGKIFKLETDSLLYPLQDGDIIELGRTVLLKFEVIE